ncbi:MAG: AtpZ/AtpI family protein [Thermoanaerobaculaceae bacterium]|nr:AtpZ/AtpI family protein [Thermoanaerobaculaceae bacterium]
MSGERRRRTSQSFRRIADASSLGLAFPIAVVIGYFFGRWLDRVLGTAPWMMAIFSIFGIAAGFLNALRTAIRIGREEDEESSRSDRGGKPPDEES